MMKFLMVSSYDDLLDHTTHQGFEINDTTRQRVIGYVKAEIASQAHFYNYPLDEKIDALMSTVDDVDFDGLLFEFFNAELSINITTKLECLM